MHFRVNDWPLISCQCHKAHDSSIDSYSLDVGLLLPYINERAPLYQSNGVDLSEN